MLHGIAKFFKFCFYAVLIALGVTFCVANRTRIDISLFPLARGVTLPLFIFALLIFALGLLLGWIVARYGSLKHYFSHKESTRRIAALENELTALRSEQLIKPTTLAHNDPAR